MILLCLAICCVFFISSAENWGFSLRNGGMFKVQFLGVKISSIVNPLSAITPSFGSSSSTSPDLRVIFPVAYRSSIEGRYKRYCSGW